MSLGFWANLTLVLFSFTIIYEMNSHNKTLTQEAPCFLLTPATVTHEKIIRHPIFWLHEKHRRSVTAEPYVVPDLGLYDVMYRNDRNGTIFIDKKSAELYLGLPIPESTYAGQLHTQKTRNAFFFSVCGHCGHVDCIKTAAVFKGPFDVINGPITIEREYPCVACWKGISMEISTESSLKNNTGQDCDIAI